MNGPNGQSKSDSTRKQSDGPNLLAQVRARQASEQYREAAKKERQRLAKAKNEFRAWKRDLCRIINTDSEMVRNRDGSYSYVLPPAITRLVYEVMLREHMRMKDCSREEAENAVRQGFVGAVEQIDQIVTAQQAAGELKDGDAVKTPLGVGRVVDRTPEEEQSEQEAAASLAKMREELVREKAGELQDGDGTD